MLLAGPLLVVFAALVAPGPEFTARNLDLLLSGGGVWVACEGAALLAGGAESAVAVHLTQMADALRCCMKRGSMVATGVWLLRGGLAAVAAAAKVLAADHSPARGTWFLLATSSLVAAGAGLGVVAAGIWLLVSALGAPFPWASGRALLDHFKQAVKQVSLHVYGSRSGGVTAIQACS
jgi:hypothetical protein